LLGTLNGSSALSRLINHTVDRRLGGHHGWNGHSDKYNPCLCQKSNSDCLTGCFPTIFLLQWRNI